MLPRRSDDEHTQHLRWLSSDDILNPSLFLLSPETVKAQFPQAPVIFHDLDEGHTEEYPILEDPPPPISFNWGSVPRIIRNLESFDQREALGVVESWWEELIVSKMGSIQIVYYSYCILQFILWVLLACLVSSESPGRAMEDNIKKPFLKAGYCTWILLLANSTVFWLDAAPDLRKSLTFLTTYRHCILQLISPYIQIVCERLGLDSTEFGLTESTDASEETIEDDDNKSSIRQFLDTPLMNACLGAYGAMLLLPAALLTFGLFLVMTGEVVFPSGSTLALHSAALAPTVLTGELIGRRSAETFHFSAASIAGTGGAFIWIARATLITVPIHRIMTVPYIGPHFHYNSTNLVNSHLVETRINNFASDNTDDNTDDDTDDDTDDNENQTLLIKSRVGGGRRTVAFIVGLGLIAASVMAQEIIMIPLHISPPLAASIISVESLVLGTLFIPLLCMLLPGIDYNGSFENIVDTTIMITKNKYILVWSAAYFSIAILRCILGRILILRVPGILISLPYIGSTLTYLVFQSYIPSPVTLITRHWLTNALVMSGISLSLFALLVWNYVAILEWEEKILMDCSSSTPSDDGEEEQKNTAYFRATLPSSIIEAHTSMLHLPCGPPLSINDTLRA